MIVIGNPGLGDEVVLENAISRGVMSAKTVIEGMNFYQMSIAINPGNSGGPVFDSTGRVIGVATLKANKAEAMGFCIPVEELKAASKELVRSHPEMIARHRAVATFNALTLAGAIYVAGIVAHSGRLGASREELEKLHETVKNLDEKLFSHVDTEVSGLQSDAALSPRARRNYQELSANYKAMKQVYGYPTQQVNQYANHVQDLRKQHYNLVVSIRDELQVEVPAKLLAILQEPTGGNQQQVDGGRNDAAADATRVPPARPRDDGPASARCRKPRSSAAQPDDAANGAAETTDAKPDARYSAARSSVRHGSRCKSKCSRDFDLERSFRSIGRPRPSVAPSSAPCPAGGPGLR